MNYLRIAMPAVALAAALTGCSTMSPTSMPTHPPACRKDTPAMTRQPIEQRIDTRTVTGDDVSAPRFIYIWDRSVSQSKVTADIEQKTSGILAQRGFTVMGDHPNILVEIRTSTELADKMGSSRVYRGTADVTVFIREGTDKKGARLLGSEQFETRGERKLSETEALNSLSDAISQRIANWLAPLVVSDSMGIANTRFRAQEAFRELDREIERYNNN